MSRLQNFKPLLEPEFRAELKGAANAGAAAVAKKYGLSSPQAAYGLLARQVGLLWLISRSARRGRVAATVGWSAVLVTSTVQDEVGRLERSLAEPPKQDPFADLIARATRGAKTGRI